MSSPGACYGMAVAALAMLLPGSAGAADNAISPPRVPVPADFLEYLASLEGKDENWTDFEVVQESPPPRKSTPVAVDAAKAQPK